MAKTGDWELAIDIAAECTYYGYWVNIDETIPNNTTPNPCACPRW
ncbi:MAG TPA: hypothetical protein VME46_20240 [Acidimicrobiales bacterium]|nr:hypothetical protein [Acidimicrobiales bacterium]